MTTSAALLPEHYMDSVVQLRITYNLLLLAFKCKDCQPVLCCWSVRQLCLLGSCKKLGLRLVYCTKAEALATP